MQIGYFAATAAVGVAFAHRDDGVADGTIYHRRLTGEQVGPDAKEPRQRLRRGSFMRPRKIAPVGHLVPAARYSFKANGSAQQRFRESQTELHRGGGGAQHSMN